MSFQYTEVFITIASFNVNTLVDFYTQLFGENPTTLQPDIYAEFRFSGLRLGIFKPKTTHRQEFANSSNSKISFCLEVKNLAAAIAHLTNLGYPPPGEISLAAHGREIYAYDPDGNRLILYEAKRFDSETYKNY
ncbi:VOC family protein [Nostoc sp. FACHB-110]|uniref:VOC family protein n=1 Tax=Nostoc sp. FACHB-110 TaxID=2692834 RepID=UPI001688516C|nr:VOC family protein [Nostoc sp. FACHB-110]MBD2435978.1 VOC family protein [Nostoc sp. FACHB-110]